MRKLIGIIWFILLLALPIQAKEGDVIKVGFPNVVGLSEMDEVGEYIGLTYEYLLEISKYTGWQYEFVTGSIDALVDQLHKGEIDLMGGMFYNEATTQLFEYPAYKSGASYTYLSVRKDNKRIQPGDFKSFQNIVIGIRPYSTKRIKELENYLCANGISYTLKEYKSDEEYKEALQSKEVDAILTTDLAKVKETRIVARFGEQPYYFATKKGNTAIINELNYALEKILSIDPNYNREIYFKYFGGDELYEFSLTAEEYNFIKTSKVLRVGVVPGLEPISYIDSKTKEFKGISAELFNYITDQTGLQFEFIEGQHYEAIQQMMENGEIDLMTSVTKDRYHLQDPHMILTKSYMESPIVLIRNKNYNFQQGQIMLAVPKIYSEQVIRHHNTLSYKVYESVEACLDAVNRGEAQLTFMNIHTYSLLKGIHYFPNLMEEYISEFRDSQSIGISRKMDKNLICIIDKALLNLEDNELEFIISQSKELYREEKDFRNLIYENPLPFMLIGGFIVMLILVIVLLFLLMVIKKSAIDGLTEVFNREAGEKAIREAMKKSRKGYKGALHLIDIDYFKRVNDELGHATGDQELIEFAQVLKTIYSRGTIICRWGGDEFVVFVKNDLSNENLNEKAERLRRRMEKILKREDKEVEVSVSIGIATMNEEMAFDTLYKNADEALYLSKAKGRNTVTFWQE